jgi:hypothetical protein
LKLHDFKVLTFDCYGTLIDWESRMVKALAPLTDRLGGRLTRDEILEAHARHEASQERQTPTKRYREVLAIVYKRISCTPRKACSMTMRPPTVSGSNPAGSTGATHNKGLEQPCTRVKCRITILDSTAWAK